MSNGPIMDLVAKGDQDKWKTAEEKLTNDLKAKRDEYDTLSETLQRKNLEWEQTKKNFDDTIEQYKDKNTNCDSLNALCRV